jgi:hypothetical protein
MTNPPTPPEDLIVLTGFSYSDCDLPAPEPVEPFAFLHDDLLPPAFTPVEPAAFALACVQSLWGAHGPRN